MSQGSFDTLLAIDTSTRYLRLALSYGGDRLIKVGEDAEQSHGQMIMKKVSDILVSAETSAAKLDGIAVCTGPGSFTGLRIGIAAAKGMAVAAEIPIIGVSIFETCAYMLREESRPVEIITAVRRDEFIVARVAAGHADLAAIRVVATDKLSDVIGENLFAFVGLNLPPAEQTAAARNLSHRIEFDASHILQIGQDKLRRGISDDLAGLEPLYVQKSQAEIRFEQRQR